MKVNGQQAGGSCPYKHKIYGKTPESKRGDKWENMEEKWMKKQTTRMKSKDQKERNRQEAVTG